MGAPAAFQVDGRVLVAGVLDQEHGDEIRGQVKLVSGTAAADGDRRLDGAREDLGIVADRFDDPGLDGSLGPGPGPGVVERDLCAVRDFCQCGSHGFLQSLVVLSPSS